MASYWRLAEFLKGQTADRVRMTFEELEAVLGRALPASARRHRAWWGNSAVGHSHARAWLEAGWRVASVDLVREVVVFARAELGTGGHVEAAAGGALPRASEEGARVHRGSRTIAGGAGKRLAPPRRRVRGPALPIIDRERLLKIFRLFAVLDAIRWQVAENYNVVNYCVDSLNAEQKLLTHWVSYITDRGMPYETVWEVGGYALSYAVLIFTERGAAGVVDQCLRAVGDDPASGWRWVAPLLGPNEVLRRRGIDSGPVEFASRYMPADTVSIVRTLQFLESCCGGSLGRFVARVVEGAGDGAEKLNRLAAALHGVSYAGVGQVSNADLPAAVEHQRARAEDEAGAFAEDRQSWLEVCERRFEGARYGSKRLWAALRDWVKSPEFNPLFVEALGTAGSREAGEWGRGSRLQREALVALEVPGDVWNNNPRLMEGLVAPSVGEMPGKMGASQLLRLLYEQSGAVEEGMYPEQFDVTFDFAPRMCAQDMCEVCPFGAGVKVLCRPMKDEYCPALVVWCGYLYRCPGAEVCEVRRLATSSRRICPLESGQGNAAVQGM